MLRQCKQCGAWIETDFGHDAPAEHVDAAGTEDDPRSPGESDDICDVCEWGTG